MLDGYINGKSDYRSEMTLFEDRDSVISGASWQYISSILLVVVGGLFYIFIIHSYSSQVVGVFSLISAIGYLFSIVFSLGLQQGTQHFISYHLGKGEEDYVRAFIRKFLLVSALLSIIGSLSLWSLSPLFSFWFFHTYAYLDYLRLVDVELFSMIFNSILLFILVGLQNFKLNGILNIVNISVGYGLIIPFIIINASPIRIIYAWIIGYYLTTALSFYAVRKRVIKREKGELLKVEILPVFSYSIPIFISGLFSYGATYVDRFIVSYLLNLSELGIYNFSLLIVNAFGILIGPFAIILLSRLSFFYGNNDFNNFRLYSLKASEVLAALYVPLALIVAALSPSILLFLANRTYLPGYEPIMIILISSSMTVSVNIFSVTLQAIKKTRLFILSSSLALLANFVISIIMIPKYGIDGAAVGYASSNIAFFIVILYFSKKYETYAVNMAKMFKIYVSGVAVFFLMIIVQDRLGYSVLKLFIYVVTGIAVYLFLVRITGVFSEEDMDLFLQMVPNNYLRLKKFFKSLFV